MFPKIIAYAWIASVLISIVVAVDRDQPIARAFMPIKKFKAFVWQLMLLAWVVILVALQLYGIPEILGQRPVTWAYLMAAIYSWICMWHYFQNGK